MPLEDSREPCPGSKKYFYFFKLVGLLADFIAAIALVRYLGDKRKEILWLLLLIVNPVFIYNSYCWLQGRWHSYYVRFFIVFIAYAKPHILECIFLHIGNKL